MARGETEFEKLTTFRRLTNRGRPTKTSEVCLRGFGVESVAIAVQLYLPWYEIEYSQS